MAEYAPIAANSLAPRDEAEDTVPSQVAASKHNSALRDERTNTTAAQPTASPNSSATHATAGEPIVAVAEAPSQSKIPVPSPITTNSDLSAQTASTASNKDNTSAAESTIAYLSSLRASHYATPSNALPELRTTLPLSPPAYLHFLALLKPLHDLRKFLRLTHGPRFEYSSARSELTFRRRCSEHDFVTREFAARCLQRQINALRKQEQHEELKEYMWGICSRNHAKLALDFDWPRPRLAKGADVDVPERLRGLSRRCPDSFFWHLEDEEVHATVVVEVAYAQSQRELKQMAQDIVCGTKGKVAAVVGIKLDYGKSGRAWISLWRPQSTVTSSGKKVLGMGAEVEKEVSATDAQGTSPRLRKADKHIPLAQLWRNKDKSPVTSMPAIMLPLTDFIPEHVMPHPALRALAAVAPITITAEHLCETFGVWEERMLNPPVPKLGEDFDDFVYADESERRGFVEQYDSNESDGSLWLDREEEESSDVGRAD